MIAEYFGPDIKQAVKAIMKGRGTLIPTLYKEKAGTPIDGW